jgi:hypothetical protein
VLFDRRRRSLAWQCLDVRGYRDGLNVFELLVAGTFTPEKKLLDRPVIGSPRIGVADGNRKKLEELFAG